MIERNIRLMRWIVRHQLPMWMRRLAGGLGYLYVDLYEYYIKAVDKWLSSDRTYKLSTFIGGAVWWGALRLLPSYRVITVPPTGREATQRTRELQRRQRELVRNVKYFQGEESECEDPAVIYEYQPSFDPIGKELIRQALLFLTPRLRLVIELRYGFSCQPCNLEETARVIGVTRERVRQLEFQAIRKLKSCPLAARLENLLMG